VGFWKVGLEFWGRFPDLSERLIGYGFNGHFQSRVVFGYYHSGSFVSSPVALTLHNSYMQQMYDTGYAGLMALIAALWIVGHRFSRAGLLPVSAAVGAIYLTGMVEVFLDPSFRAAPIMVIMALSVIQPRPSGLQDDARASDVGAHAARRERGWKVGLYGGRPADPGSWPRPR
jgi:hypothetical protein